MIAMPETCDLLSLAGGLRSGNFSCSDYLSRLEALFDAAETELHAFLPEHDRFARLRQEAADLFERYPDPQHRPPLFAVPFAVDDAYHVSGFVTRAGSHLEPELLSGPEAPCVHALRRAGGLILGKTATAEFGYTASAPTHHPYDPTRALAMASGGAAAAVAGGLAPLALGTQNLGGTNVAACLCGVVGFKPSYQRISTEGMIALAPSLDHAGLLAANVASLDYVLGLLMPRRHLSPASGNLKIGIPDGVIPDAVDPRVSEHFQATCDALSAAGCSVQVVPGSQRPEDLHRLSRDLISAEAARVHSSWYAAHPERYGKEFAELIERGKRVPALTAERARTMRLILRTRFERLMERHQLDVWLSPAVTALHDSGAGADSAFALIWTVSGLPSLVVPAGWAEDQPLGIQLAGRWYGDEDLLQCGRLIEKTLEESTLRPSRWF